MLINIDTTIATVYQSGALMDVAMSHLGVRDVRGISFPQNDVRFRKLDKFLHNLRINTRTTNKRTKTIKGLVPSAGYYEFEKDGRMMTVRVSVGAIWGSSEHLLIGVSCRTISARLGTLTSNTRTLLV